MIMQKVEIVLLSIAGLLAVATARPAGLGFLTFENGNIGVNFGGYSAQAGLGGLLTGDRTQGGLHASAGTPYGPKAQAGLGGITSGQGFTGGRLYADAGLGPGNPNAAAGLGGVVNGQGYTGGQLYANADSGHGNPKAAAGLGGVVNGQGYTGGQLYANADVGQGNPKAVAGLGGVVGGHGNQGGLYAGATTGGEGHGVVESVPSYGSVQPSVVGKTVKNEVYKSVPGSVAFRKTIDSRVSQSALSDQSVPTFVPQQPSLVNVEHIQKVKTRVTPKKQKTRISTVVNTRVNPSVESGVLVEKAIYPVAPVGNWHVQKYVETQSSPVEQNYYSNAAPVPVSAGSAGIGGGAGIYGGVFGGGYGSNVGTNHYVNTQQNSQFFDDIFNIPISTLTAVNQLLRNKGK